MMATDQAARFFSAQASGVMLRYDGAPEDKEVVLKM